MILLITVWLGYLSIQWVRYQLFTTGSANKQHYYIGIYGASKAVDNDLGVMGPTVAQLGSRLSHCGCIPSIGGGLWLLRPFTHKMNHFRQVQMSFSVAGSTNLQNI